MRQQGLVADPQSGRGDALSAVGSGEGVVPVLPVLSQDVAEVRAARHSARRARRWGSCPSPGGIRG